MRRACGASRRRAARAVRLSEPGGGADRGSRDLGAEAGAFAGRGAGGAHGGRLREEAHLRARGGGEPPRHPARRACGAAWGATPAEVQAEFDRRRGLGEFQQAANRTYGTERRFTTPKTLAAERANIAKMREGRARPRR